MKDERVLGAIRRLDSAVNAIEQDDLISAHAYVIGAQLELDAARGALWAEISRQQALRQSAWKTA